MDINKILFNIVSNAGQRWRHAWRVSSALFSHVPPDSDWYGQRDWRRVYSDTGLQPELHRGYVPLVYQMLVVKNNKKFIYGEITHTLTHYAGTHVTCYNKCIKKFFGFCRLDSMTQILIRLHLSSFDTLLHNARISFDKQCSISSNCLIRYLAQLMSCLLYTSDAADE